MGLLLLTRPEQESDDLHLKGCVLGGRCNIKLSGSYRRAEFQGSDLSIQHDLKRKRKMSLTQLYFLSKGAT